MPFSNTEIILATVWLFTIIVCGVRLRRNARIQRRLRRDIRKQKSIRDCVLNLLGKSTQMVRDALDKGTFLNFYADYSAQSLSAQSAAFFSYDTQNKTVKAEAVIGVFPTLLNAPQNKIDMISYSPGRLRDFLINTAFSLSETPFASAIKNQHTTIFDEKYIKENVPYLVIDCWTMMIIPTYANNTVVGVLVVANKKGHAQFNTDDLKLADRLAEMASISLSHILSFQEMEDKRRMDTQLQNAAIIQHHLLPQNIPKYDSCELSVYFQPAYHLGGDYYDFIQIDDEHLGIIVADVSGKSITAGLVMATARSLVTVLSPHQLSPASVLCALNTHLLQLIPEEMFVTMSYAILNTKTREMITARAGHEPSLRCSPLHEACCLSNQSGMVLGMVDNTIFAPTIEDVSCRLEPGEYVLFYTDGVTEAHNDRNEEFGRNELAASLRSVTKMDADSAMNFIVQRIKRFTQGHSPYDDITLVMVRVL
jgi:phosphoserine phosphatase RsbU/P